MLLSENEKMLHFFNEAFKVESCNRLRNVILNDVNKWIEFFGYSYDNVFLSILNSVKHNFSALKIRAEKIHDDHSLERSLFSMNEYLAQNKIPSFNILKNRLHTDNPEKVLLYLFGLFGGSIDYVTKETIVRKNFNFYLAGIGDQDSYLNRSKSLENIYKEAKNNAKEIEKAFGVSKNIFKEYQNILDGLQSTYGALKKSLIEGDKLRQKELSEKTNEFLAKMDVKFHEATAKLDAVIPRAENAAKEKIKLISLQELWDEKHKFHDGKESQWFDVLKWSIGIGIFVLIAGIFLISLFIPANENRIIDLPIVATGVLVVVVFWFIRLVTKIWLSHSHLKNDAHERSVMTKTYLALMVDNDLSTEQNNMAFQAMFRPIKDGIVKDEGPNSPVLEIVDKLRKPS